MSETVMVIEKKLLRPYLGGHNYGQFITDMCDQILDDLIINHKFMPRSEAEYNFKYKQVIPYVIVRNGIDYLLLKRTTGQTETRLHNKFSLGIGGHINPVPSVSGNDIILHSLHRELNEEILLNDISELQFTGIINDESNSVSKVHLGLLYVLHVSSPVYQVRETEKMTAQWMTGDQIINFYDNLETWSQIAYDRHISETIS